MLEQEIMPQLLVPPEDLAAYALTVRHRFANPHIRHRWQDVALNGPAKYRVRLLPHLLAQMEKSGRPPRFLVLSLAAWSAIDRAFSSHAPEQARLPGNEDVTALISDFLGDTSLWGQNLNQPMLHRAVAGAYRRVREAALSHNGILELLDSLTTANAAYD
jgi:tagaturonate reductase